MDEICKKCGMVFYLRPLKAELGIEMTDYYEKYEEEYCPSCRLELLTNEGVNIWSFLRDAVVIGYSLQDIEEEPELRFIELRLTTGESFKIEVKNTRFLHDPESRYWNNLKLP